MAVNSIFPRRHARVDDRGYQQRALKDWITARLPRSTKVIGAWIEKNFALSYSRPGLIALLHRLGFDYRKPREAPRHLNEAKQKTFIAGYEKLLNTMDMDEAVVFVDAVHLSFPKIPSGLDSSRAAESSHDLGRCLQSCTRSERWSSICSSREAGLAPRICFSAISSPLHCGGRRLVVDCAAVTARCSPG